MLSFLAGTTIDEAVGEAKRLAQDLNLAYCGFNFNGFTIKVSQSADVDRTVDEYMGFDKGKNHKYIIG